MSLAPLASVPFTSNEIAVAISHSDFGGGHIGIGYFSAKDGPKVLHLAWHRLLKNDAIPGQIETCWGATPLPLPPLASKQIVAFVRAVAAKGSTINYGINFIAARGSFAANGSYKPPKGSDGLTCATFVLEILSACSVRLLRTETWRASEENIAWGRNVCALLARTDPDHAAIVAGNVNGLRIRPFEIAGATASPVSSWPLDFDCAQAPAQTAAAALDCLCNR